MDVAKALRHKLSESEDKIRLQILDPTHSSAKVMLISGLNG